MEYIVRTAAPIMTSCRFFFALRLLLVVAALHQRGWWPGVDHAAYSSFRKQIR
jgi:hypothetical protein